MNNAGQNVPMVTYILRKFMHEKLPQRNEALSADSIRRYADALVLAAKEPTLEKFWTTFNDQIAGFEDMYCEELVSVSEQIVDGCNAFQ